MKGYKMQSIRVKRASFKQDGISIYDHPVGTVEVSIGNTTIEARARRHGREDISVAGFVGRDDRSGRFNKQNGISYEPDTYAQIAHMKAFEADAQ